MNVGADQVMVVLGCVLALQERIMEQLTRDRAQQQRQLETTNARFEAFVLRLQMRLVPDFPGALTNAATQTAALRRAWSSYTVEILRCKREAISQ